jgi:hypothetical protein
VELRYQVVHHAHGGILSLSAYICVMSFIRLKTIKGKQYAYRQTSVRKGKKVRSIMEYISVVGGGVVNVAGATVFAARDMAGLDEPKLYGTPLRGTDQRANRHQEAYERELFDKDREAFNSLNRMQYRQHQRSRDAAKADRESKMSRADKREQTEAKAEAQRKWEADAEAVREFNDARTAEKASHSDSEPSAK